MNCFRSNSPILLPFSDRIRLSPGPVASDKQKPLMRLHGHGPYVHFYELACKSIWAPRNVDKSGLAKARTKEFTRSVGSLRSASVSQRIFFESGSSSPMSPEYRQWASWLPSLEDAPPWALSELLTFRANRGFQMIFHAIETFHMEIDDLANDNHFRRFQFVLLA